MRSMNDLNRQYPHHVGSTKVTERHTAEVTILETVALSTEEDMSLPLEKL